MKRQLEDLIQETKQALNIFTLSEYKEPELLSVLLLKKRAVTDEEIKKLLLEEGIGDFFGYGKPQTQSEPDNNKQNLENALNKARVFIDKAKSEMGSRTSISPDEYKKYIEDLRQVFSSVGPANSQSSTVAPSAPVSPKSETSPLFKPSSVTPMASLVRSSTTSGPALPEVPAAEISSEPDTEVPTETEVSAEEETVPNWNNKKAMLAAEAEAEKARSGETYDMPGSIDAQSTDLAKQINSGTPLAPNVKVDIPKALPSTPKPRQETPIQDLAKNLKVTPTSISTAPPIEQQPIVDRVRNVAPTPPVARPIAAPSSGTSNFRPNVAKISIPRGRTRAEDNNAAVQSARNLTAERTAAKQPSPLTNSVAPGRVSASGTNLPSTPVAGVGSNQNPTPLQQFTSNPTRVGVTPPVLNTKKRPYVDQNKALASQAGQTLHRVREEEVYLDPDESLFE